MTVDNSSTTPARPWYKAWWAIGVAGLAVGLVIGGVAGAALFTTDPETTSSYQSMQDQRDNALKKVDQIDEREADLDKLAAETDDLLKEAADDRAELEEDADNLADREKAVGIAEKKRDANSVSGSGVYEVGVDMKAGRYKSDGGASCYYAVLRSTDSADIVANGIPGGQAFATVAKGQYFETRDCGEWVKQ